MGVSRFFLLSTVMVVAATPVHAGFEFKPAPRMAPPTVAAAAQNAPVVEPMNLDSGGPLTPMPIEPVAESDIMSAPPIPASQSSPASSPTPQENRANKQVQNLRVAGFGKDIPLNLAMSQIVPPSYRVDYAPDVDQNMLVSWNGNNRPWADVVDQILRTQNLTVALSGAVITISNVGGASTMPLASPDTQVLWRAQAGSTLRETLTQWAKTHNAYLEWQSAYDYPITNAFSFDGSFDRAVDALLTLYQTDKNPPKGKLYPNQPNGPVVLVVQ